jgi:hypothetical protein
MAFLVFFVFMPETRDEHARKRGDAAVALEDAADE